MLPYTTVEEAEAALKRTLTVAETLWLKYSANKSDYLLYCHNLPFFFLSFSLVPLPLIAVELIPYFRRYKTQPHVKTPLPQMMACYMNVIKTYILYVGPFQLLSYPAVKLIGIRTGLPLPSVWEVLVQLAIYFFIEDYTSYWLHRWLHSKWGYDNIHRVHHEYTAPMGFAAPCAHWAEILILGFPAFLGPAIVPGHMITFWLWFVLRNIEAIETHCGYDFPWSPTKYVPFYGGADYHDYHHFVGRQSQSNFASVFTYCDYIYGTDKGYRYQKKLLAKEMSQRREVRRSREVNHNVCTVFVSNLPPTLDRFGLRGVFQKVGAVSDAFIPQRRYGSRTPRFGFVRFKLPNAARKSIALLNNAIVRGQRIRVTMARQQKSGRRSRQGLYGYNSRIKYIWKRKEQPQQTKVVINQGKITEAYKIIGNTNEEALEWLKRSIVGESGKPIEIHTLHEALVVKAGLQITIRAMSCYKFIITFPSSSLMEDSLEGHGVLDEWFTHIQRWNPAEQVDTRQARIAVYGVPVHGWTEFNFEKIAEVWGRLLKIDQSVNSTLCYQSLRMLIATDHLYRIEGDILLQIGDMGYRVTVSEVDEHVPSPISANQAYSQAYNHQGKLQQKEPTMEGVAQESEQEEANSNSKVKHGLVEGEAGQGALPIQNSSEELNQERPQLSPAGSGHSTTRTKTFCGNQQACTEDLINARKNESQHTSAVRNRKTLTRANEVILDLDSNHKDKGISNTSSSIGPPPGFGQGTNKTVVPNSIEENDSPARSEDSIEKLAKESIQIGNILGLKITHNEEGAVARITRTLRSSRKKLQHSPEKSGNLQRIKRRI